MGSKSIWNLRTKALLIIGSILVAMIAVLYAATDRILFTSFDKVEKTTTIRNVDRVTDAFADELQGLSNYTSAYSVWDDTIDFVKRGQSQTFAQNAADDYVDSNITDATFESEEHNLFAFVNPAGKVVWDAGFDLSAGKKRPVSASLRKYFTAGSALIKYKDESDYKNGFVQVDEGLMYISIQPLVDSDGEPPIEGTVATGRDFNTDRIEKVESKTHLQFSIFKLNDNNLPSDVALAKTKITDAAPIYIEAPNSKTIHGYKQLNDINDQPILMLRVEVPREVYRQGLAARNYTVLALLGIGIAFLGMAMVLLTRLYRRDNELQELKDRFIAIASHELRTPLTSIRGGVDLLAMATKPEQTQSSIKLIQQGTARLTQLTDELINISTIEKGQLKASKESTDIVQLVRDVCASVEGNAKAKGLSLNCNAAANMPKIPADARLLRGAVLNLVDNAIKFTNRGGVTVKTEVRGKQIAIEVADTGPGIPEEVAHMLFKKFGKTASVSESFKEGHGLGLYLAKLATEAHGGKIDAISTTNGSTFTILLPIGKA